VKETDEGGDNTKRIPIGLEINEYNMQGKPKLPKAQDVGSPMSSGSSKRSGRRIKSKSGGIPSFPIPKPKGHSA